MNEIPEEILSASSQKKLLYLAEKNSISVEELQRLFWLLNCPKKLHSFPLFFHNLQEILKLLQSHANIRLADYNIDIWLIISNWICKNVGKWSNIFDELSLLSPKERGKESIEELKRNGLYAMCCCSHENPDCATHYRLLQGHCILAHVLVTPNLSSQKNYQKSGTIPDPKQQTYSATLGLRQVSYNENIILLEKFNPFQNFKEFQHSLASVNRSLSSFKEFNTANYLKTFIKFILQLRSRKTVPQTRLSSRNNQSHQDSTLGSGYISPEYFYKIENLFEDEDDPCNDWGRLESIAETIGDRPLTDEEREELEEDVHPGELSPGGELQSSDFGKKEKKGAPSHYSAKEQQNHKKMANQNFHWSFDVLTFTELNDLVKAIDSNFERILSKIRTSEDDLLLLDSIILISVMLWTSSKLSRAVTLEIHKKNNIPSECDFALCIDSDKPLWKIRSANPQHFKDLEVNAKKIRPASDHIFLPDLLEVSVKIQKLIQFKELSPRTYGPLFKSSKKTYEAVIKKFLAEIDHERLVITKVENFIYLKIIEETQVEAIATAITARQEKRNSVKSFYFSPSQSFLVNKYARVIQNICHIISPNKKIIEPTSTSNDLYVGAKFCPRLESVKETICALKDKLRAIPLTLEQLIDLHNDYTLFTILMFGYTTGMRAIKSPLYSTKQINEYHSYCIFEEKKDKYGSKPRPVYVTPMLYDQLKFYEKHCRLVIKKLKISRTTTKDYTCFFINESKEVEEVTPKGVGEKMRAYLPAPANIHRRFIFTYFTEKDAPPEVLNTWMGHVSLGLESWADCSSLAYDHYTQSLKDFLFPFLENTLGWEAVESPLVKINA